MDPVRLLLALLVSLFGDGYLELINIEHCTLEFVISFDLASLYDDIVIFWSMEAFGNLDCSGRDLWFDPFPVSYEWF